MTVGMHSLLSRSLTTCRPKNPLPPVTTTRLPLNIGVHHHVHKRMELHCGFPAKKAAGFAGIALQYVNFGGAVESWVNGYVVAPIQPGAGKGAGYKFFDRMRFAGCQHVVIAGILLDHSPHVFNIFLSKSPLAFCVQISQREHLLVAAPDSPNCFCNLSRNEFLATARAFVIKQDAARNVHTVAFAVIYCIPVRSRFCCAVWAAWMKNCFFALRGRGTAKHLAAASLIESRG